MREKTRHAAGAITRAWRKTREAGFPTAASIDAGGSRDTAVAASDRADLSPSNDLDVLRKPLCGASEKAGRGSSRVRPPRSRGRLPWRSRLQLPGAATASPAGAAPPSTSTRTLAGDVDATVSSQAARSLEGAGRSQSASRVAALARPAARGGTPVSSSVTPGVANGAERPFASEPCSVAEEGQAPEAPAVRLSDVANCPEGRFASELCSVREEGRDVARAPVVTSLPSPNTAAPVLPSVPTTPTEASHRASSNELHGCLDGSSGPAGAQRSRDDDSGSTEVLMGAPCSTEPATPSSTIHLSVRHAEAGVEPSPTVLSERSEPSYESRRSVKGPEGGGRRPVSLLIKRPFALDGSTKRAPVLWPFRFAAVSLVATLALVAVPSSSLANTGPEPQPYWRLTEEALPAQLSPGGSGVLLLHLENVGDTASTAGVPITVVDQLPQGVLATRAAGVTGESLALEPTGLWGECSVAGGGRTVTCTYQNGATVPPVSSAPGGPNHTGVGLHSFAPPIGIEVEVDPNTSGALVDTATVSGGGAPNTASSTATIQASHPPELAAVPFGISSFDQWSTNAVGTPAVQAGSHPYETTTDITFFTKPSTKPAGVARSLDVELPAGFVGDPRGLPRCTRPEFDERLGGDLYPVCPSDTQVGVATVYIAPNFPTQLPIYNLVPPVGTPVQFGLAFSKFVGLLDATVVLARHGEYVVAIDSQDIQTEGVTKVVADFWGDPAERSHDSLRSFPGAGEIGNGISGNPIGPIPSDLAPKPFLRLPTSCGVPQAVSISADSWEDPLMVSAQGASTDEQGNPVSMEECEKLDFSPSLELTPEAKATDTGTGIEANLRLQQNEDPNGLAEADLKNASVTLPPDWSLSPAAANGLAACTPEQIGIGNERQPTCPAASKIGDVEVTTPLLEHSLEGEIYVAQQGTVDGSLLGGYLVVDDAKTGVLIKLPGRFEVGGQEGVKGLQPGQIRAVFENSPQFPFSDLKLKFFGGPHAALMTPDTCGSSSASTEFTGWNGSTVEPESNPISTNAGCSPTNAPSLSAGTTSANAGEHTPFSLTLKREDGTQHWGAVTVTLPPGLLGTLKGVGKCPNANLEAAEHLNKPGDGAVEQAIPSCPASSEIGTVTATAGPGAEPVSVTGREYLAGPYEGAPFSLDAITPAVAGPFDLGVVVVRQGLYIDKATGQPTVKSDPLPTMVQGVPLDIRSLTVNVTRPNFTFNPTSCGQEAVTGTVTSTEGSTVGVSSNFKAAGCSKLPFRPTLSISTGPKATKVDGASLKVKMTQKPGEANIHRLDLTIPTQLPARLTTLQKACSEKQFEANPAGCPKASIIGTAKAVTPVLEQPLSGPIILVSHGGAAFPDVEMVLQAEGITIVVDGRSDIKKGITYSRFETVPDAPVTSFEATLPTGPNSIFAGVVKGEVNTSLCGTAFKVPTELEGYNGAIIKETSKVGVSGCPKAKAARKRKATTSTRKHRTKLVHEATTGAWGFAGLRTELAAFVERGMDSTRRAL
jgi:hypothetical protein